VEVTLADGQERVVGPGALLLAPRGTRHQVRVPGPEPAVLLCSVAPNVDAPDEQVNL
jgi:mannose-6-phosphate isomerase-like protein (cupin superfamily)